MAQTTTPVVTLYPDGVLSVVTDDSSGADLPVAIIVQPSAGMPVAWEIYYQGSAITGRADAGADAQTIQLPGALAPEDLVSVSLGTEITVTSVNPTGTKA